MRKKNGKKLSFVFKILVVFAVFIVSVIFFSSGVKENLFEDDSRTVAMKEASFPLV